jgi:hypothetical protein
MDVKALQEIIAADLEAHKIPLFIITDLGASLCGEVDNVKLINEICHKNNIWLHAQGHCLAALAVMKGPLTEIKPLTDSMTLNLTNWLGISNVPCVLIHRQLPNYTPTIFEIDPFLSNRMSSLSLWTTLQVCGVDSISERITLAFDSCQQLYGVLNKIDGIRILVSNRHCMPDGHIRFIYAYRQFHF